MAGRATYPEWLGREDSRTLISLKNIARYRQNYRQEKICVEGGSIALFAKCLTAFSFQREQARSTGKLAANRPNL